MDKTTVILLVIVSGALICAVAAIVADALHVRRRAGPAGPERKIYSRTYYPGALSEPYAPEPIEDLLRNPWSSGGGLGATSPGYEPGLALDASPDREAPTYELPAAESQSMQLEAPDPTPAPSYDPGPSLDAAPFDSTPCDGGGECRRGCLLIVRGKITVRLQELGGRVRQLREELEKAMAERGRFDLQIMEKEKEISVAIDQVVRETRSPGAIQVALTGMQRRMERFKELSNLGHSKSEIARMMGTCERTVERWERRVYAPVPVPTTPAE